MVFNPWRGWGGGRGKLGKAVLRLKQVEAALPHSISFSGGNLAVPALPTLVAAGHWPRAALEHLERGSRDRGTEF